MRRLIHAVFATAFLLQIAAARAEPASDTASIWTLQGENAAITVARLADRYYTNGLRLGWTSPTDAVPTLLTSLGNSLWGSGQQRFGFDLSHQIYSPRATHLVHPDPRDRPYAGYLSANFSLLSDTDTTRSLLMLGLGIIGPAAGGQALQNGFHDLVSQGSNNGWGSQMASA